MASFQDSDKDKLNEIRDLMQRNFDFAQNLSYSSLPALFLSYSIIRLGSALDFLGPSSLLW
jgi:hypothetical protein